MATIQDVANWFLCKAPMSHKKIQKLCYYAQAWSYALLNEPIAIANFEAWQHGPVSPVLYELYQGSGWEDIQPSNRNFNFSDKQTDLLESVYLTYGEMSANALEVTSHSEVPWLEARRGLSLDVPSKNVIDPKQMRKFYKSIYIGDDKDAVLSVNDVVENLAEKIWEEVNRQIPVDPVLVAAQYNIDVFKASLKKDISGAILKKEGKARIYISTDQPPTRERFTIAHELGHFFLHMTNENEGIKDYKRDTFSSSGLDQKEIDANNFAAALLMNRKVVQETWNKYKSIPYLAKYFNVSAEALKYRLSNLGVEIQ